MEDKPSEAVIAIVITCRVCRCECVKRLVIACSDDFVDLTLICGGLLVVQIVDFLLGGVPKIPLAIHAPFVAPSHLELLSPSERKTRNLRKSGEPEDLPSPRLPARSERRPDDAFDRAEDSEIV